LALLQAGIESALQALEGNATTGAADAAAIRDLFDMMSHTNTKVAAGLPDEKSYPGIIDDKSLLNCWYHRGLKSASTTGTLVSVFPTFKNTEFSGAIPIMGWGTPSEQEWTLLGSTKFWLLNGSTVGLRYGVYSSLAAYGCEVKNPALAASNTTSKYTREDGWSDLVESAIDWNDGATIRTQLNTCVPRTRHSFFNHVFAGHLAAAIEFHFVDIADVDYQIWADADDLCVNHAMMLAREFDVPYI
jgi:hypothetical protein